MPAPSRPALITRWRSYLDVSGDAVEVTWDELFAALSTPIAYAGDTQHPGWSPASCHPPTRKDAHVRELSALVLDYDGTASIEQAREMWAALFGCLHTTRKHTEASHRFRVVLALSRRVSPTEHALLWRHANMLVCRAGSSLDASTRNPSRFWYLPGTKAEDGAFEAHLLTGTPLDVDAVLSEMKAQAEPPTTHTAPREQPVTLRIRRASHYLAKMDPSISGSGGHDAAWKAALVLCRGFDLPTAVALDLLEREFNHRCSPPWSRAELQHKVDSASSDARVPEGYLLDDARATDWHTRVKPPQQQAPSSDAHDLEDLNAIPDGPPAPRVRAFAIIPARDIFASLPPVPWLVEGLDFTPGAPAVFAGYGYSRKTVAAQALGLQVAGGRCVWGQFQARRDRVLHIDYEQGNRLTRERYQRLARGCGIEPHEVDGALDLVVLPTTYLDSPGAVDIFARELDGYGFCIVDSFRAAAPSADENSSDVRRHLDLLTRASEKTGCVPLVVHHAGKPSKDRGSDGRLALRGSSGIFDACSSVFVFSAEKGEPTLVSHVKARTSGILTEDFYLDTDDVPGPDGNPRAGLVVTYKTVEQVAAADDMSPDDSPFERLKQAILLCVADAGEMKSGNAIVARVTGGNKSTKLQAIQELLDEGRLWATSKGGPYRVKP